MHTVARIFVFTAVSRRIHSKIRPTGGNKTDAAISPAIERYHGVDSWDANIFMSPYVNDYSMGRSGMGRPGWIAPDYLTPASPRLLTVRRESVWSCSL